MKKLYTLLLLLTIALGYSQATLVSQYLLCDDNTDGVASFYLPNKNPEILGNLNVAEHVVSYYQTLSDAESATNPIPNFAYSNTANPQQIFACVTNIQTQESSYFYFNLVVSPKPIAYPATLTMCNTAIPLVYNLDDAAPQILGGQQNLTATFYTSANGGIVIPGGPFTPTEFPVQVLGVELNNGSCSSERTTITLNTTTCTTPPCITPTFLNVSNVSSYSATLSWNGPIQNGFQVIVLPAGSPAPTPNTTGNAFVQTPPFVMTGLMPNTCYVFYVRSSCAGSTFSQYVGPYNFCTQNNCENNGECPDNLTLVAFLDANDNGIKDDGEAQFDLGLFDYEINNSGTTLQGYSNYGNFTIFDSNPDNAYDLNFTVNPDFAPYYSSTTAFTDIHITAGTGTHTYYFPVTLLQSYNDLQVQLIPADPPRPGFTYTVYLKFKNKGTTNIPSGEVAFIKDDAVSILFTSPSIPINAVNGFSYVFTNLAVNEERLIAISMQVPTIPTVMLGQVVTNTAFVGSSVEDAFLSNNTAPLSQTIVGSYDPNDKIEAHGGKIAVDTFTTDDSLTYTIQFENTGTASAEFVRVEDLLDAGLNPHSVEMLNASHAYNMRRIDNKLTWNFYNINLPTTASNPTQSHGYIQFKVKPTSGYAVGTLIPNAADIYFDYNTAIVTNTFATEFVATLAVNLFDANGFYMYPNPATTFVNLSLKDTAGSIAAINVYDVLGKSVKAINNIQSDAISIDVSLLSKGMYFVAITTENNLKVTKKLIID